MSDDGNTAIVVIAMLGNPFSPKYARARGRIGARGPVEALDFCAMNVALYTKEASAWSLTERRVAAGDRTSSGVTIGSSAMRWEGDRLVVTIDERTAPLRRPIQGTIILHPEVHTGVELSIDERDQHRWWPVAPLARIEVDLPIPGVRFSGHGYHDANAGDVPLPWTFANWSWSRARTDEGALLTYDVACVSGSEHSLAFKVSPGGAIDDLERIGMTSLPRTRWGIERRARVDEGHGGRIVRTLEDGPFYARALVETRLGGRTVLAMHETLAADRLRSPLVRFFTGFRMLHGR